MTIPLTVGISTNDRMLPLILGDIQTPGLELHFDRSSPRQIFKRAIEDGAFDVTEMSFAAYCILLSRGECQFIGIPVFLSRMFRHGCIFVRTDSSIETPEQLSKARIGIPEYQMTAVVWLRGILNEYYGVDPRGVTWIRGGVNTANTRGEKIPLYLPEGYEVLDIANGQCLNHALLNGDIDALITTQIPSGLAEGRIRHLFRDFRHTELQYYNSSEIFPIMHLLVLRRELYERIPYIAVSLYDAFLAAKIASLDRLYDIDSLFVMVPWLIPEISDTFNTFGPDPWPYGFTKNQKVFEIFLNYLRHQELITAPLLTKDLYPNELLNT